MHIITGTSWYSWERDPWNWRNQKLLHQSFAWLDNAEPENIADKTWFNVVVETFEIPEVQFTACTRSYWKALGYQARTLWNQLFPSWDGHSQTMPKENLWYQVRVCVAFRIIHFTRNFFISAPSACCLIAIDSVVQFSSFVFKMSNRKANAFFKMFSRLWHLSRKHWAK